MPETRINHYEGMFLLSQASTADMAGAIDHLRAILKKVGAELIAMCRWDERRLAYEIAKQKRGLYILTYFACDARKLGALERECNLSETILRSMITRADHLTEDEMRAADAQDTLLTEVNLRRDREVESEVEAEPAGAENE